MECLRYITFLIIRISPRRGKFGDYDEIESRLEYQARVTSASVDILHLQASYVWKLSAFPKENVIYRS